MIRRSSLILFEILVGTLVTLGFGVAFAAWRLSQGPIELVPIKRQIETQLSQARGGRPVKIDRVELAWSTTNRALELKARGVKALSADGKLLTESRAVDIGLSLQRLAFGRLAVERATFDGADLTMTLARDGSAGIAFGPPGSPPDFVIPPASPNETPTQRVNRLLDGFVSIFRPVGIGGALREVRVEHVRLTMVDEPRDSTWRAESARIDLRRDGAGLRLAAHAEFRGPRGRAPATFKIATDTSFSKATLTFTTKGVQPTALLPEAALGPISGLQAPITAAIVVGLDRKIGVTLINGDVSVGRGALAIAGGRMDISGARVRGNYNLASDELVIDEIAVDGGKTRIQGQIAIRKASAFLGASATEPAHFDVSLPSVNIDAPGVFATPVSLRGVSIKGQIAPRDATVTFDEAVVMIDRARLALTGRLYWANDGHGVIRPGIALNGDIAGAVNARSILALWPLKLAAGAREWLETGIVAGRLLNTHIHADITPANMAEGAIPNDRLSVAADYEGAHVVYLEGMTPITEARGHAELKGNRFDLTATSGRVGPLAVSQGRVELPRIVPKGAVATFAGHAEGDARAMVDLVHQMPIDGLAESFPVQKATVVGRGVADFAVHRPLLSNVPRGSLTFNVDARLENAGGVARNGKYTISGWRLHAVGDQRAITFSGPLTINHSQANLTWTESFQARAAPPSRYVIDGQFDARDLEQLGIGVAQYARGVVGVQLRGDGHGMNVATGTVRADLKDADIALPKNMWVKRAGRPATASFDLREIAGGGLALNNIDMRGPGFTANGAVTVTADNALSTVNLQRVWIDGRTDLRVTGHRSREGVLLVAANGPMFDAAPFMSADAPPAPARPASGAPAPTIPAVAPPPPPASTDRWDVAIQTDRVMMKGDASLANGRVEAAWTGPVMTRLDVRGGGPGNSTFVLSLGGPDGAASGPIAFRADDMGFAYRAVTGADNVRGGAVEARGTWTAQTARADFVLKAKNFQVVKLGAMARLLSSVGSLRGMAETLNGDGVSFTGLEAPMTIVDGRMYVAESRAAGPSLGITVKGTVQLANGALDLDGVLVPAYGLNSILSGVPVLGQLLASRPGEGVIGMTYSISGLSDSPRVGVNPLSALTPGILRRIFEPWSAPAGAPKPAVANAG